MRQLVALLVATSLQSDSNVRSHEPFLRRALAQAVERSATVRHQLARLQAAKVLVYLHSGPCIGSDTMACTILAPANGPVRVVRINFVLNKDRGVVTVIKQQRDRLLAQIAHELEHAIEIAESPDVVDAVSLQRLYERIGFPSTSSPQGFETAAAVRAGEAALREVRHR
jgi:hypothetical protein